VLEGSLDVTIIRALRRKFLTSFQALNRPKLHVVEHAEIDGSNQLKPVKVKSFILAAHA
jgi:hypothetical protein